MIKIEVSEELNLQLGIIIASNTSRKTAAMSEESPRFIRPVECLPPSRGKKNGIYDEIINEFQKSCLTCAEVRDLGRKPQTVQIMLNYRLRKRKERIRVVLRNKKVYLERLHGTQGAYDTSMDCPQRTLIDFDLKQSDTKVRPSIDVTSILNTMIVKIRCPNCRALNAKDSSECRECYYKFYENKEARLEAIRSMEKLEKELNGE